MKASVESRPAISTLAVAEVVATPYRTLPALGFFLFLQLRNHTEVFERCGVAFHFSICSQFAQQAAHNFSAAGLGEGIGKANVIRLGEGTYFFRHPFAQLFFQLGGRSAPSSERDERGNGLA